MSESGEKWRTTELYFRKMLAINGEVLSRFETAHIMMLYFFAEGLALLGKLEQKDVKVTTLRRN